MKAPPDNKWVRPRNMEYLPPLLRSCMWEHSRARHAQKPAFKRPFVMLQRQNGRAWAATLAPSLAALTSDLDTRQKCPNVPANAHLAPSKPPQWVHTKLWGSRASLMAISLILSKPAIRRVSEYAERSNLSPNGLEGAVIFHIRRTDKGAREEIVTCAIVSDSNIIGLSKSDSLNSVGTETTELSCSRLTSSHSANCSNLAFCIDCSLADFKRYWSRTLVHQRIIMDIFNCVRDENPGKEKRVNT